MYLVFAKTFKDQHSSYKNLSTVDKWKGNYKYVKHEEIFPHCTPLNLHIPEQHTKVKKAVIPSATNIKEVVVFEPFQNTGKFY